LPEVADARPAPKLRPSADGVPLGLAEIRIAANGRQNSPRGEVKGGPATSSVLTDGEPEDVSPPSALTASPARNRSTAAVRSRIIAAK
jgi:hypothetical protein